MTVERGSFLRQVPTAQSGPGQLTRGQSPGDQDARSDCSGQSEVEVRDRNGAPDTRLNDSCWRWWAGLGVRPAHLDGEHGRVVAGDPSQTVIEAKLVALVEAGSPVESDARGGPSGALMWALRNRPCYAKRLGVRRATTLGPDGFHNRRLWHTPWLARASRPI